MILTKKMKSPVELNAVVLCKIDSFDVRGNSQAYVRKMIVRQVPNSSDENIVLEVLDSSERSYGFCDVTITQFNKLITSGEFKIVSNSSIKIAS